MDSAINAPPHANLACLLPDRAARHPDRLAIVEYRRGRRRQVTFAELEQAVAGAAAELRRRGIGPGDRVLVFVPMSISLYTTLLACLTVGAAAVFVDAWADRRRLDAAVAAAHPRAFIGIPKAHLLRLVSPAVRRIPVALTPGSGRRSGNAMDPTPLPQDAPALVTLTTGSTGRPKAAARSHAFLWAQHLALAAHLRQSEADVDMPTLPIFVLNNLALGVTTVLPDVDPRRPAEADPARVYQQLVAERVTTSGGSPAFYARLAEWCAATGRRLPLRALFTGGAPVLPPLARLLRETVEGEAHVVYGSTEAEPIAGLTVGEMLAAMEGLSGPAGLCVGSPMPEIALRLIRPHDGPVTLDSRDWSAWEVGEGEVGEIAVAGAHVLTGYLDDPDADRENKIRDGERTWHRTGDAAWQDSDGRLWLMGRVSHRVRRAGGTVWPLPAELRATACPGVTHAAYFGLPDPDLGERAVLCVEARAPQSAAALRVALAPLPADEVRVLDHIPRDLRHASKTDTQALRRRLS